MGAGAVRFLSGREAGQPDVLVVGQGLAGTVLAWCLQREGVAVRVADDGHAHSASRAAGGVMAPIAGQRFTRPEELEAMLDAAWSVYGALEDALGARFAEPMPILRLMQDADERARGEQRLLDERYRPYLSGPIAPGAAGSSRIRDPHGSFAIRGGGRVRVDALLVAVRRELSRAGCLEVGDADPAAFERVEGGVRWGRLRARWVVFCDGARLGRNPWFAHLPMQPAKGETLTIRPAEPLVEDRIVSAGKWLLPLGEGYCRVGATYDRETLDARPTPQARRALLEALGGQLLRGAPEAEVVAQRAGIRVAVRDKWPVVGMNPRTPEVGVLNGFASKGVLMIPYYARALAAHLARGVELPEPADVARYDG